MALNIKKRSGIFPPTKPPVRKPNLSTLALQRWFHGRQAVVEFGSTSEAGTYSSFICESLNLRQRSPRRHLWWGNTVQWIFHCRCVDVCYCCYGRVGKQTVEPWWRKKQGEEATSGTFCLVPCSFQNPIVCPLPEITVRGDTLHSCLHSQGKVSRQKDVENGNTWNGAHCTSLPPEKAVTLSFQI